MWKKRSSLHICLIAINICSCFSPLKGTTLRFRLNNWRDQPGTPQSSQPCWVLTFHSWLVCLFDFEPQWVCIWLHGNEALKWQKRSAYTSRGVWASKEWPLVKTCFELSFGLPSESVRDPQETMPHLIAQARGFWRKIVWPSWSTTIWGQLCSK